MTFVSPYIKRIPECELAANGGAKQDGGTVRMDYQEQSDHEHMYAGSEQSMADEEQKNKQEECTQTEESEQSMADEEQEDKQDECTQTEESEQSMSDEEQEDKQDECTQTEENAITGTNDNPRKLFLLSLLPEINGMTESQMIIFRRKVLRLIDEVSSVPDTIQ
jgi:hypothetical protein